MELGPKFKKALEFAISVHAGQVRKGTSIPYIAHLLAVCSLVLTNGGSEEQAITALLHDSLEDHPEKVSAAEIEQRFGRRVMEFVVACTDTPAGYSGGPKPPWRKRKVAYLDHIRSTGPKGSIVSLADKLDNARAIVADYRQVGDDLWSRFSAGKVEQLWYYRELVVAFHEAGVQSPMLDELERLVKELIRLVGNAAV
ncbi:MAG: HD domain-containing protein [Syntrophobacteraceae bacterium]